MFGLACCMAEDFCVIFRRTGGRGAESILYPIFYLLRFETAAAVLRKIFFVPEIDSWKEKDETNLFRGQKRVSPEPPGLDLGKGAKAFPWVGLSAILAVFPCHSCRKITIRY